MDGTSAQNLRVWRRTTTKINRLSGHPSAPPPPFGYYCRYVTYHSNLTLPAALAIPRVPPRLDPTTTGRVACQNSSAPNIATFL